MTEKTPHIDDYVHDDYAQIERRYIPDSDARDLLNDTFTNNRTRITQLQLSHTSEPYNLCMRKHTPEGKPPDFRVEIKNVGMMSEDGWRRMQIPADIDRELFEQYEDQDVPIVKKWRAYPLDNRDVHIDFFDNGHVHAKSRNPKSWTQFIRSYDLSENFADITGNPLSSSEWHAHNDYKRSHGGREILAPRTNPSVDHAISEIHAWRSIHSEKPIVQVSGRSGSGKTYFAHLIEQELSNGSNPLRAIVLSTDEYNRGRTELYRRGGGTWHNYDADEVWDTLEFGQDMQRLRSGESIPKIYFNYDTEEREIVGTINPDEYDVIVYEGVKSHSPDLHGLADLAYEVPTPLATSLGRRIVRDLMTRPRFADPKANLTYYLTYAEPEYSRLYLLCTS